MICFPNAKINIGLNIIRKREDGYHDIESIMYPLKGIVYDALEIIQSSEFGVQSSGIKIPGDEKNNLCVKAYHLIAKDYPLPPIKIYLHKAIPIGAGLGGGSADGAFMIRLLNDEFKLGLAWGEMHHYARQLGSDCSFFISNQPVFAEGKGDELEPVQLSLSNYHIAVVYPNIHINTAEAYREMDEGQGTRDEGKKQLIELIKLPIEKWKGNIVNDFEEAIFPKQPEIKKIKEKLYSLGALYASMSGSGSAVYGIFNPLDRRPTGFKKETKVKKYFRKLQVWEGKLT
ncbi:MAG: 4-(cytidine 5'-diphospho)-2-C-methyl-D-erythritol kinase [Bacteroidetes bacterium]|nr:4-(cytidine 5'-diphospho)-2-C-methyl-D-erythritol kinase [Bacteroidota bacterium]